MIYNLKINDKTIPSLFFYEEELGLFLFSKYEIDINYNEISFDIKGNDIYLVNRDINDYIVKRICNDKYNSYVFMYKNKGFSDVKYYNLQMLDNQDNIYSSADILDMLALITTLSNGNYIVSNVVDYISVIEKLINKYKNKEHFYRGHYSYKYKMIPSLFRKPKFYNNESDMYMDFKTLFYNELSNKKYIEILTTMQHYKMPTRLLDTTSNPLVALFMASDKPLGYQKKYSFSLGEVIFMAEEKKNVKYSDSNITKILSSLSVLDTKYKQELYDNIMLYKNTGNKDAYINSDAYKRFKSELQNELAYFDESIFDPLILLNHIHVKVGMINERIISQSGNFILFGLCNYETGEFGSIQSQIQERIFIYNKQKLLNQLNMLNISNSTMYPDKDHASLEIIKSYDK